MVGLLSDVIESGLLRGGRMLLELLLTFNVFLGLAPAPALLGFRGAQCWFVSNNNTYFCLGPVSQVVCSSCDCAKVNCNNKSLYKTTYVN